MLSVRGDDSADHCGGAQQLFLSEMPARATFGAAPDQTQTSTKRLSRLAASKKRLEAAAGDLLPRGGISKKSSLVGVEE